MFLTWGRRCIKNISFKIPWKNIYWRYQVENKFYINISTVFWSWMLHCFIAVLEEGGMNFIHNMKQKSIIWIQWERKKEKKCHAEKYITFFTYFFYFVTCWFCHGRRSPAANQSPVAKVCLSGKFSLLLPARAAHSMTFSEWFGNSREGLTLRRAMTCSSVFSLTLSRITKSAQRMLWQALLKAL